MLQVLEEKGVTVTPFEVQQGISKGYIKRCAEKDTSVGSEILDKFLKAIPGINPYWLITGEGEGRIDVKPVTSEFSEAMSMLKELQQNYIQSLEETVKDLRGAVADLRSSVADKARIISLIESSQGSTKQA